MRHSASATGQAQRSPANIDFYIQATSFMAGFARAVEQADTSTNKHFADILQLLPFAADLLDGGRGTIQRNFYRFDITNFDGDGTTPYWLYGHQFYHEAAISPFFFSIPWYFSQWGRQPGAFEEFYFPPYENHYRTNFLSSTIRNTNRDNVSVIVTDLIEHRFATEQIVSSLAEFITDSEKAIFMFSFRLPFYGNVYNATYPQEADMHHDGQGNWQMLWHDGTRPLYILVLGDAQDVFEYSYLLRSGLENLDGLTFDYMFFHRNNEINTTFNFHNYSTIERDVTAHIYRNHGLQVRWYRNSGLVLQHENEEITPLDERVILYLDIIPNFAEPDARLDIAIPFTLPQFWMPENTEFYLTHNIEYLRDEITGWHPVSADRARDIMARSEIDWANTTSLDELTLTLRINVEENNPNQSIRPLGNHPRNRFRVTTYVRVRRDNVLPGWISNYSAVESNHYLIHNPIIFSQYTVGLSQMLTQLSIRAGYFGVGEESSGIVANILVYAVVGQRANI